jgi:hypothetical protein
VRWLGFYVNPNRYERGESYEKGNRSINAET